MSTKTKQPTPKRTGTATNGKSILKWATRVDEAAKALGMSRAETAEYLDISATYWNALLTGGRNGQAEIGRDLLERSTKLLALSAKKREGGSIAQWAMRVDEAAKERGMTRAETADYLGISMGYWNTLLAGGGSNQVEVGRELLARSAALLSTSVLSAYLLSGQLTGRDLYFATDHEAELRRHYSIMLDNPDLASYMPSPKEWAALSVRARYGITVLYNMATRNELMKRVALVMPPSTNKPPQP